MNSDQNSYKFLASSNWISSESATRLKTKIIPPGATVFAKIGEALKAERLRLVVTATAIDNNMMAAIAKDETDPLFLRYLLEDIHLARWAQGSALPFLRSGDLEKIPVLVPPLAAQKELASILGCIDEKMDSIRQTMRLAQRLAEAVFESKFLVGNTSETKVSHSFPKVRLGDILEQRRDSAKAGLDPELPYVPIDSLKTKSLAITEWRPNGDAKSSLIKFKRDDILIGAMRVYFHRVALAPFAGLTRTTTFVLRASEPQYLEYALFLCNLDSTIQFASSTSKGSTMPYAVWEGGLAELEVPLPGHDKLTEFANEVQPMLEVIRNAGTLLARLSEMRETLLPTLFEGRVELSGRKK